MPYTHDWRQAVQEFADEMRRLYGSRLRQVVLYGSRARGEADPDSDIDLLVILDPPFDFWEELNRLDPFADRISLAHDVVISAVPVNAAEYAAGEKPLLMNAQAEGVAIA